MIGNEIADLVPSHWQQRARRPPSNAVKGLFLSPLLDVGRYEGQVEFWAPAYEPTSGI